MQFKLSVLTTVALATLAAASPLQARGGGGGGDCNTGSLQCCNTVQSASDPSTSTLLGLLGIVLGDITAMVGLGCSPISLVGIGGSSCSAHPVCCQNNAAGSIALPTLFLNLYN
ncbi:hydrophobin-251 [Mucidula mucida]|nr:hydrophobin-251 [Mucidula mucida]